MSPAPIPAVLSVHNFELLPQSPKARPPQVWPNWPMILRTSSSHRAARVDDGQRPSRHEGDSRQRVRAPLRARAAGAWLPPDTPIAQLGCELTERGNVKAGSDYQTTVPGVFACGDARRGQSLVVWLIWEGRECARGVDAWLMGETALPTSPEL